MIKKKTKKLESLQNYNSISIIRGLLSRAQVKSQPRLSRMQALLHMIKVLQTKNGWVCNTTVSGITTILIQANSYHTQDTPWTTSDHLKLECYRLWQPPTYGSYSTPNVLSAVHVNQHYFNLFLPLLISIMVGFTYITFISL